MTALTTTHPAPSTIPQTTPPPEPPQVENPTAAPSSPSSRRLLSSEEVRAMLGGLKPTAFYTLVKRDDFPEPVRLGSRLSRYWEHEVLAFMESLPRGKATAPCQRRA